MHYIGTKCVRVSVCVLIYLCFVAAATTLVGVCACVGDGHESAQVAHVHLVRVRCLEQTLPQELGGPVSNLTITLHLTETQSTVTETHTDTHSSCEQSDNHFSPISPKRIPPSLKHTQLKSHTHARTHTQAHRDLPSMGCLLRICTGPRAREWILSSTMCLRRW